MKLVSARPVGVNEEGQQVVDAVLVSDDLPDVLPTTGAGIIGLGAHCVFAPFSLLYIINNPAAAKVYLANEAGVFVPQPTSLDIANKADKIAQGVIGHFTSITADGNIEDSGYSNTSFLKPSDKGAINGVASLDQAGQVPASQLPTSCNVQNGTLVINTENS